MEQSHGLCDNMLRQRDDAQREMERLRTNYRELERTLGTRERAHRHRLKGLEEQVHTHTHCCVTHPLLPAESLRCHEPFHREHSSPPAVLSHIRLSWKKTKIFQMKKFRCSSESPLRHHQIQMEAWRAGETLCLPTLLPWSPGHEDVVEYRELLVLNYILIPQWMCGRDGASASGERMLFLFPTLIRNEEAFWMKIEYQFSPVLMQ